MFRSSLSALRLRRGGRRPDVPAQGPDRSRVGAGPPLILFLSAVILAAWYGGLGPGLFAAVLSALVCAMAYLSSSGPVVITRENNLFRLGLFLWEGALISLLMERLHAARRSSDANASDARRYLEVSRESEERFRSLSACSPVGIYLADLEGRCLYTNPRCQEIFGLCLEETLGEGWARFLHPADRARVLERWAEAARGAGASTKRIASSDPGETSAGCTTGRRRSSPPGGAAGPCGDGRGHHRVERRESGRPCRRSGWRPSAR